MTKLKKYRIQNHLKFSDDSYYNHRCKLIDEMLGVLENEETEFESEQNKNQLLQLTQCIYNETTRNGKVE